MNLPGEQMLAASNHSLSSRTLRQLISVGALCTTILFAVCAFNASGMPVNYWREGGNNHGLTNLSGKEIVPAVYPSIYYYEHGLFLLQERSPTDWLQMRPGKLLINQYGAKISFKVPQGKLFEKVLWLGNACEKEPKVVPTKLADDTLLVYKDGPLFGICDKYGTIILPFLLRTISHCAEDLTVVQDSNGKLFIFNVRTRQIKELQLAVDSPEISFRDGLASFQHGRGTGFIDSKGKVVIPPKYFSASSFFGGQSLCCLPDAQNNARQNVIINKKGEIVSPTNLKLSNLYGGFMVASKEGSRLGVVNRKFQYVIQPEFEVLIPQPSEVRFDSDAWSVDSKPPLFYYAIKHKGESPCVVSLKGDVLFKLPDKVILPNYPPRVAEGVIVCAVWIDDNHQKSVYLNLQGAVISPPFSSLPQKKGVTYRKIAPTVLLKTFDCGDNYFNSKIPHDSGRLRFN